MGNKPPGSEGFEMPQAMNGPPGANANNLPYNYQQGQAQAQQAPDINLQHSMSNEIAAETNMAQLDQYPNNAQNMNQYAPQQQQFQPMPNQPQAPPAAYDYAQQQQPPPQQQQHPQQIPQQQQQQMPPPQQQQPQMEAIGGKCAHIGCRCSAYKENPSKWSKGKCKTCNHIESEHKQAVQAQFGFEQNTAAVAPKQNKNVKNLNIGYPSDSKPKNMMYNAPKLPPNKKKLPAIENSNSVQKGTPPNAQSALDQNPNQNAFSSFNPPSTNASNYASSPAPSNASIYNPPPIQNPSTREAVVTSQRNVNAPMYNAPSQNNINAPQNYNSPSQNNINAQQNYNNAPSQSNMNVPPNYNTNQNAYNKSRSPRNPPNKPPAPSPKGPKPKRAWPNKPVPHHKGSLPPRSSKTLPTFQPAQPLKHSADFSSLQAKPLQAKNKESVYMDMTIAEVERMQAKQGNLANKIPTANLDKNKTVRQILEEHKTKQSTQNQANAIVSALKANPNPQPPAKNPWSSGSGAWNKALGPNANMNTNPNVNTQSNVNMNANANTAKKAPSNNTNNAMSPPINENNMNNMNQGQQSSQQNKAKPAPINPATNNNNFQPPPPQQQAQKNRNRHSGSGNSPNTPVNTGNNNVATPTTQKQSRPNNMNQKRPQQQRGTPTTQQQQQRGGNNMNFTPPTRMRATSDQSSAGGAPAFRPKPKYAQARQPFNPSQQHKPWKPPPAASNHRNNNRNTPPGHRNNNNFQQKKAFQQKAPYQNNNNNNNNNAAGPFQAMTGFNPTTAGGLQAKNVGQKMGPKGLQHQDIRKPATNPWNAAPSGATSPYMAQNNRPAAYRPPPPAARFKSYNKKEARQKIAARQQQKQQKKNRGQYPPPEVLAAQDGTNYDSDESVFVTQAEIARRHSWGSSSLEPTVNNHPFGKPVHVNKGREDHNLNDSNVAFSDDADSAKYPAQHKTEEELVSSLELSEKEFYKKYWIEDGTVGTGSFAKVRKVTRKKDKKEFALKMIKKAGKTKEDLEALQREIAILAKLSHPNVVKLMDWCETKKRIYMVVQFCSGGDVFERILKQKTFSEKEAAHVVRAVAEGLKHVHENNIIHRDLKPDNLMYLTKEASSNIMIIDFGLAGDATHGPLTTPCGTAHYVAPEVLSSKAYNSKADMWSLGVIIYMLLCGFPPFFDAQGNQKRLYKLIKLGKYRFPTPYWDYVGDKAKDLIRNLLQLDPQKRYSAQQVLEHKWIKKSESIEEMDLGKIYMEQMEHFSSSRHFVDQGLKLHQPGAAKIGGANGVKVNQQQNQPQEKRISYFKHHEHAPKFDVDDDW